MFVQSVKMAFSSILSNKMRSFLTMLGIIIGVVALVVLVSVVDGATGEVTDVVSSLGTNLLSVTITDDKGRPLRLQELEELRGIEELAELAPNGTGMLTIRCGAEEDTASVTGTTAGYAAIEGLEVDYGRYFNAADTDNHLNVAVVNPATVRDILRNEDIGSAVGSELIIGGIPFQVIGVLEEEDENVSMFQFTSYSVHVPYTSLMRLSGGSVGVRSFLASAVSDEQLDALENKVGMWMLRRFGDDEKAFSIINMSTIMGAMDQIMNTMTVMLGGIAAISLLVGGIGIMNIMLVSVTERTREIGIRKAIGAGEGTILLQFLIEALMLSLMGCALGVAVSYGMLQAINYFSGHNFGMSPQIVTTSIVFSLVIGMIFGIYPARKAARKKPIDALHYAG